MIKPRRIGLALVCTQLAACSSLSGKDSSGERTATELYTLKAIQYMEVGRLDIAMHDLLHAIELDDHNFEAHNALGVLYERLGQLAEAEHEFKEAMALQPGSASVANNYGRLLCAQGKYEAGMALFLKTTDSKLYASPWMPMTNAGLCAKTSGKLQDAENYFRKALESNPTFPPALLEMAKLSLESGNALSARAFLQRFEAATEPTPESLLAGAQTEQALGNDKEAAGYLKKLQRLFPDSREALKYRRSHASQPSNNPPIR